MDAQHADKLPATLAEYLHTRRALGYTLVRTFARFVSFTDPDVEVPAMGLLPYSPPRATPYLYSDREIAALMGATSILCCPQRQATMATLVGLLAGTGMRVGEAISLDVSDIDRGRQLLLVRDSKFGKTP
jgi:integrase